MRYLDPTISNYTKAITAGIGPAHEYAVRLQFDNQHGERAERLVVAAQFRCALEEGDMQWHELPRWVQQELEREARLDAMDDDAPPPAPADRRYSSHVERKLTRKRRQVLEDRQQAQERADTRSMRGLERLADAWGARVKGEIAPLRRG